MDGSGRADTMQGKETPSDEVAGEDRALVIDPRRLARACLLSCVAANLGLVALDYHVNYGKLTEIGALRRFSNIAREDGLASWFGTTQTMLAALTLWLIFVLVRNEGGSKLRRRGWLTLALFFTYMAVDDGAEIHERLGSTYDALQPFEGSFLESFPSYTWQLLFLPLFGAIGLFMLWFLWRELQGVGAKLTVAAAIACLVFAVGLDFIEGLEDDHPRNLYTWISERPGLDEWTRTRFEKSGRAAVRHFAKSMEESVEMLANTLLWFVFLAHLEVAAAGTSIQLGRRASG